MSPEILATLVGALVAIVTTFTYIIRMVFTTRNEARKQAIVSRARQDKIESDARQDKLENQKREHESEAKREALINKLVLDFKAEIAENKEEIRNLRRDLTDALVVNGELTGKLAILVDNQKDDREKLSRLSKRIAELEHDKQSKTELIVTLKTKNANLELELVASKNQITGLEQIIASRNNVKPNVQPVKTADKSIETKKDNE